MKARIVIFTAVMLIVLTVIGIIFWEQEVKYAMPTPVPSNFVDVQIGDKLDLAPHVNLNSGKKTLLHFFSSKCSCSRFNMKEFERISRKYEEEIDFYVVIQSEDENALRDFQKKYELDLPTILDRNGTISDICGIYATPQAVIIDEKSNLYFKGNYNKARYCTRKETRYVETAISYLLVDEQLPLDVAMGMTQPYGCTLPSDVDHHEGLEVTLLSIFNQK